MADIIDYTIGQDAKFYPDYFLNATALGVADATITSSVFMFGKNQSGTELCITADAAIVIASSETLIITLVQSETADFASTTSKVLATLPAATYAAASDLVRYVSDKNTLPYCKITLVATEDLSAKAVTGNLRYISR